MLRCYICFEIKEKHQFPRRHKGVVSQGTGLRPWCKACAGEPRLVHNFKTMARLRVKKYGLTEAKYFDLVEAQEAKCKLCDTGATKDNILVVDHDHLSGHVRALLCHPCNRRLGLWETYRTEFEEYLALTSKRISRDQLLLKIAATVALRSTCTRASVGAIIAREGRILSTGYNGAPKGMAHCTHTTDEPCEVSGHAESNSLAWAARWGISVAGAELFTTYTPCLFCAKLIINSGITRVVSSKRYRDKRGLELLKQAGVKVE